MASNDYIFVTRWRVAASINEVWEAINDAAAYPSWWKAVLSVTPATPGQPGGIARSDAFVWRAPLGYKLRLTMRITTVERPHRLGGIASGELEGTGNWTLREDGSGTLVRYDWRVRTRRAWMNVLAPVARPVFKRSHDAVMSDGARGLARLLGTTVVDSDRA